MKYIMEDDGFTLIEVVASLVIIVIILLSFSQLFIQSNKTAAYNNEKLVTINLADAALERIKSAPFTKNPTITNVNNYFIDNTEIDPSKKNPPTEILMNGKKYKIQYKASQETTKNNYTNAKYSEKELDLIKVVVTVTAPNGKTKGSSEGYVSIE